MKLYKRIVTLVLLTVVIPLSLSAAGDSNAVSSKKRTAKYLETSGEQKLDLLYKEVGKRKLQLDLYYSKDEHSEEAPVGILIVKNSDHN